MTLNDLDNPSAEHPAEHAAEPVEATAHPPVGVEFDHTAVPVDADADAVIEPPPIELAPVKPDAPTFAELGVDPRIVAALTATGIERTFAIQELTLPIALQGHDLIGQARTGMGKTLGFGVPLLQRLLAEEPADAAHPAERAPRGLIIVPTRELCVQVARDLTAAASQTPLKVLAVYGGRAYEPQVSALQSGVDVVVGTPGRLLDLAKSGSLILGAVHVLVLDEADEMLDLGFLPDIERVLSMVPATKQTMLFSATMPGPIITLARTFLSRPTHIRAEAAAEGATHLTTKQFAYRAHAMDKVELIARTLQAADRGLTMIFTRTKRSAQKVADELVERGFAAAAVHGDLGQGAREQALRAFRSGKVDVLVATDVAARGIDVEGVTHVINYQSPDDEKTYVHRIGRTGRAGRTGIAVTLVDWDEMARWKMISDALSLDMADPPETYSSSAHLFAELGIPEGVTGRLMKSQRTRAGLSAEAVEDLGETGRGPRKSGRSTPEVGGRDGKRRGATTSAETRAASSDTPPTLNEAGSAEPSTEARKPRRQRERRRTRSGQESPTTAAAE